MSVTDDDDAVFRQFTDREIDQLLDLDIDVVTQSIPSPVPHWVSVRRWWVIRDDTGSIQQLRVEDNEDNEDVEEWIIARDYLQCSLEDWR